MKNKSLPMVIAYCIVAMALVLILSGCRTKKSKTDFKKTETENVSIVDNSKVDKKETIDENIISRTSSEWSDKSFFEAWMEIKSDEAIFEDKAGNKWTFKNPKVNQKSSQSNNISKTEQSTEGSNKVATNEENTQNDIVVKDKTETKTDVKQTTKTKGREPVYLWIVGGLVIGGLGYFILKRFKLISRKEKTI